MHEEMKWTQAAIGSLDKPGLYRVSPGLYLQVTGPNAKSWIYRFTVDGKTRHMGLGSARDVTLAQARRRADEIRVTKVARKVDPLAEAEAAAAQKRAAKIRAVTFRERAEEYFKAHEAIWRNAKHRLQWRSTLETYAYPVIGDVPAGDVTLTHIVEILRPIWATKFDTARKVRGRIETVLDFAADPEDLTYRNPAARTPQLIKKLPKRAKTSRRHFPALPYPETPSFLVGLQARSGAAALALEFAILTAARTNEVIGASLKEIAERGAVWIVPPERMKGYREHRVPLSIAALSVVRRAKAYGAGEFLFAGPEQSPLSNMAMLALLKRMGRRDITVHGFRSTFKDWSMERTDFAHEVSEAALAHLIDDETVRAYARGDLFEKRRRLMNTWAEFCMAKRLSTIAGLGISSADAAA